MERDTFSSITDLIRQATDDRDVSGGTIWPDEDLVAPVNGALLDLNLMLVNAGSPLLKKYSTHSLAIGDTTIDFNSLPDASNILPPDFLVPLKVWDKSPTEADRQYHDMDQTEERLPDVDPVDRLRYWMWTQSTDLDNPGMAIVTLGATAARTVRIEYACQLEGFSGDADEAIPIPGSRTVLAYDGLKRAALARGEEGLAQYADAMYKESYDRFRRLHVKASQRRGRRRIPYGMKRPYRFLIPLILGKLMVAAAEYLSP